RALETRNSEIARLSLTGSLLGMAQTAVNPPAAAALRPVATVSAYSRPGSRRCAWRSMKPGKTSRPFASRTCASGASRRSPNSATRPSSRRTSKTPSRPAAGSTTRPPLSSSGRASQRRGPTRGLPSPGGPRQKEIEDRHPDRHAVGDLLEDERTVRVGDVGGDLDAAVHGPGVHDDGLRPGAGEPRRGQAVALEVLARGREERR